MLSDFLEPFTLLECERVPDGLGGVTETWRDAADFQGGVTWAPGREIDLTELPALRTTPVLVHEYDVTLRQGDVVRRTSDGARYRVTGHSADMRTPVSADLRFAQVPVERLVTAP